MKKKLFLIGTLIFIITFWKANISLGTVQPFQCAILDIAAVEVDSNTIQGENRVYVQCKNTTDTGLSSFAIAIGTTPGNANRYLVVMNTALALGKTLTVFYDINPNNNPLGCQPADCRKITGLLLGP
jgi:hypothetical protein